MKEIWLPVRGYEGLYEVSNLGRVRSLNYWKTGKTKVLSTRPACGYLRVGLSKGGKEKMYFIHRLVAEAFLPNWFDDPCVNHIDEDKTNNNVDNLEWCSVEYNDNYGTRNKRVGEKLSKKVIQYTLCGDFVREWNSITEAERNGFSRGDIWSCCNGRYKTHKGYIWKYKEVS